MTTRRSMARLAVASLVSWAARGREALAFAPPRPTPRAPSKSLPPASRSGRSFPAGGIERVVARAVAAEEAEVVTVPGSRVVAISGMPVGGAEGYHGGDPNWRETPASAWGLDFAAKVHGTTLVISTVREMEYIHHHYNWGGLRVEVPPGVEVVKEPRKVRDRIGIAPPDLDPPK